MTDCASTNTIAALLAGAADPAAAERLEVHLDACSTCRRLVADLGRGLSALGDGKPATFAHGLPRPGESIGRYEIRCVVGVGGMGVVYEAHDTTLDRRVAVKLLRPDLLEGPSLLAEAQAMARLAHSNIATVYDAGIANGQLYICMEYVAGSTLRAWRTERRRDWRAITDCYLAAGDGLAFVHRAGLVHLDFKPDNVLVDDEGRVRVTDFGLARMVGASPLRGVVGTPAYMAPEQRSGTATDARSDQYAFCVAMREALADTDAPSWLTRVLERGLAAHREDRFATMDELLAAIRAGLAPRLRRAAAFAVVGASALVAASVSLLPSPTTFAHIIERPVMYTMTEYRDVVTAAEAAQPPPSASTRAIDVIASRTDGDVPVAAHRFVAPRRAPALHVDGLALASSPSVSSSLEAFDDSAKSTGVGASYCDDGSTLSCAWWQPSCPAGTLVAIQQGCWTCADEQTCGPLGFPRTCNDGSPLRCHQEAPDCGARRIPSVRNGCWSCEDPFTCWSWIKQPSHPPPRSPPKHEGSNSGSNAGSNGGSNSGSGSATCELDGSGSCFPVCGNGFCENGETHAACATDCCELTGNGGCTAVCGNGFCEEGETAASCPNECP